MFAKRLLEKAINRHRSNHHQHNVKHGDLTSGDLDFQISVHYGIPSTASVIAFDPIQRLLAIGTLDGRIKVIGGDGIEGLLISSRQLAFKSLEFMQNHGFLVSISIDNNVQIWNLETRCLACSMQWESNITAFSVINGAHFMYMGDEYGFLSVLKYDAEDGTLSQLPYQISPDALSSTFFLPKHRMHAYIFTHTIYIFLAACLARIKKVTLLKSQYHLLEEELTYHDNIF